MSKPEMEPEILGIAVQVDPFKLQGRYPKWFTRAHGAIFQEFRVRFLASTVFTLMILHLVRSVMNHLINIQ